MDVKEALVDMGTHWEAGMFHGFHPDGYQ